MSSLFVPFPKARLCLERTPNLQSSIDSHLKKCEYIDVSCSYASKGCGWIGIEKARKYHLENDCSVSKAIEKEQLRVKAEALRRQEKERIRLEKQANARQLAQTCRSVNPLQSDVVRLNVGGKIFLTSKKTLTKYPDSVLALLFSRQHELSKDWEEFISIDSDPDTFKLILNWLRFDIVLTSHLQDRDLQDLSVPTVTRRSLLHKIREVSTSAHSFIAGRSDISLSPIDTPRNASLQPFCSVGLPRHSEIIRP